MYIPKAKRVSFLLTTEKLFAIVILLTECVLKYCQFYMMTNHLIATLKLLGLLLGCLVLM